MAETYTREALNGGDANLWATFEQAQNHIALGLITSRLYISVGALYISKGKVGIDNGSTKGVIDISADKSISVVGLTASCWAKIEIAITAGVPVFTILSIAGETNPAVLPASFTAAYDGVKGAFYIVGTLRCPGLVFINAAGVPTGILNQIGAMNGYSGYAVSNDAYVSPLEFLFVASDFGANAGLRDIITVSSAFTIPSTPRPKTIIITTAAASFAGNVPAASLNLGVRLRFEKTDTGAGICTITRAGADTFSGATAFPLRNQYDFIEIESDGTNWHVIDSMSTLDGATNINKNTVQTLAHGLGVRPRRLPWFLVCISAEYNYSVGDEVSASPQDIATRYWGVCADATNIITNTESTSSIAVLDKTTAGTGRIITENKWKFRFRYSI